MGLSYFLKNVPEVMPLDHLGTDWVEPDGDWGGELLYFFKASPEVAGVG